MRVPPSGGTYFAKMSLEKNVIAGCKKGDRIAIRHLYEQSAGWMLGVALRYISDRNEAMSLVNLSLLNALEKLDSFDENRGEKIEAWLKTILVRKTIDYMRKEKLIHEKETNVDARGYDTNMGEGNTRKEELRSLVNRLSPSTRSVFNLYAIEGYKHKEIAEMLHISIGTSKWHLNDARKKLKAMLAVLDTKKIPG